MLPTANVKLKEETSDREQFVEGLAENFNNVSNFHLKGGSSDMNNSIIKFSSSETVLFHVINFGVCLRKAYTKWAEAIKLAETELTHTYYVHMDDMYNVHAQEYEGTRRFRFHNIPKTETNYR